MKMNNYSSRDMAIHAAADTEKALKKTLPESPFQVGDSQLKAIRESKNFLMQKFNSQAGMHYRPPSLANKTEL